MCCVFTVHAPAYLVMDAFHSAGRQYAYWIHNIALMDMPAYMMHVLLVMHTQLLLLT
jgi:hypothetical protein